MTKEAEVRVIWLQAKGFWQPSENRRGKEQILPLKPQREHSPATPGFPPSETDFGLLTSRAVKTHLC